MHNGAHLAPAIADNIGESEAAFTSEGVDLIRLAEAPTQS